MPPRIVRLDQLEATPGPGSLTWHPVRLMLSVRALGCDAYTTGEASHDVVKPHPEDPRLDHEERYLVAAVRAPGSGCGRGRARQRARGAEQAIEVRPEVANWAREDDELESLRDSAEFWALVER